MVPSGSKAEDWPQSTFCSNKNLWISFSYTKKRHENREFNFKLRMSTICVLLDISPGYNTKDE